MRPIQPADGTALARHASGFSWTMALDVALWPIHHGLTFTPDACLINFYGSDAKMGLHQDRDEKDFTQPIMTVCLGDDADFQIGGALRTDKYFNVRVHSGDVLLMGGASRMRFHGVRRIFAGTSPIEGVTGRYSLTFRKAL